MKDILTFWGWWTSLRLWLLHRKLHKYTELYLELQGGFLDLSLRPLTLKILHFEWCPSFVRAGKVWVEVKIIVDRVVNQEMCISLCSTWRFWVMLKSKQSRLTPSSSKSNKRPGCLPLRLRAPLPVYAAASGPQRPRKPGQVNRSVIFLSIKRGNSQPGRDFPYLLSKIIPLSHPLRWKEIWVYSNYAQHAYNCERILISWNPSHNHNQFRVGKIELLVPNSPCDKTVSSQRLSVSFSCFQVSTPHMHAHTHFIRDYNPFYL